MMPILSTERIGNVIFKFDFDMEIEDRIILFFILISSYQLHMLEQKQKSPQEGYGNQGCHELVMADLCRSEHNIGHELNSQQKKALEVPSKHRRK